MLLLNAPSQELLAKRLKSQTLASDWASWKRDHHQPASRLPNRSLAVQGLWFLERRVQRL